MRLGTVFRKMGLPLWTFVGIGIGAIWFNTISAVLEKWFRNRFGVDEATRGFGSYVPSLIVISVPFIIVGLIGLFQRPRRDAGRFSADSLEKPSGKKALILLVSPFEHAIVAAMFAVRYHFVEAKTLEHVWLIPSNDREKERFGAGSRPVAERIKEECERLADQEGHALSVTIHPDGVSPSDSQDTFDYVNRVFRKSKPEDVIADFTGGTKPMSVGMIMACLPRQRELEYVALNSKKESEGPFLIDYQHNVFGLIG